MIKITLKDILTFFQPIFTQIYLDLDSNQFVFYSYFTLSTLFLGLRNFLEIQSLNPTHLFSNLAEKLYWIFSFLFSCIFPFLSFQFNLKIYFFFSKFLISFFPQTFLSIIISNIFNFDHQFTQSESLESLE